MKSGKGGARFGWAVPEQLLPMLLALAAMLIATWVRVRLLQTPFERDEGEFAYTGQLILHGFPPYLHAFSMKLPGMSYLNALFLKCFGESVSGVRLGLLTANIASAVLVCVIGARAWGMAAGAVAAAIFALMTVSQHLLGLFAHATHFVVLFALAGVALLFPLRKNLSPYLLLSAGVLFGLAFTIKQHAALFPLAVTIFMLLETRPLRQAAGSAITLWFGVSLPYIAVLIHVLAKGTFGNFWFWTVKYAASYATGLTPMLGWLNFRSQMGEIFASMLLYWILAAAGLLVVLFGKSSSARNFFLPLLFCSFLAITPGFHFRPHYFILVVPVVALLAGSLFDRGLLPKTARWGLLIVVACGAVFQLWTERWFLFEAKPEEYVKKAYQTTKPFAESIAVSRYIREKTTAKDRILVLGSEPQIYFYTGRLSATGHIYMYPLMEEQPYAGIMQEGMLKEIAASRPGYLVLVDDLSSWLSVSKSGEAFRRRLNEIVRDGYELDGVAAVSRDEGSFYVFGPSARQFVPNTNSRIFVYKLKQ